MSDDRKIGPDGHEHVWVFDDLLWICTVCGAKVAEPEPVNPARWKEIAINRAARKCELEEALRAIREDFVVAAPIVAG